MADKRISVTLDIGADISKAKSAAEGLNKIFSTMGLSSSISKNLNNYINGLRNALTDLESKSSNPLQSLTDVKGIESAQRKVENYISKIKIALQDLSNRQGIDLQKAFPEYGEFVKQINQAKNAFSNATADINKNIKNQTEALSKEEKEVTRLSNRLDDLNAKQGGKSAAKSRTQANYNAGVQEMNNLTAAAEQAKTKLAEAKAELDAFEKANEEKRAKTTGNIDKRYKSLYAEENDKKEAVTEAEAEYNAATQAVENHRIKLEQLSSAAQTAANNYEKHMASIKQTSEDLETSKTKIDNLKKSLEVLQNTSIPAEAFEEFKNKIIEITGDEALSKLTNTKEGLEQIFQVIAKAEGTHLEAIANALAEAAGNVDILKKSAEGAEVPIERTRNEMQRLGETESDIAHLTSRLKYFFSLAGGFQLMRRAIRSAVETTKELDAAMTQTAVVSTKTVGEMWKTLPQYSVEAKKLGSSIVDVYKAQTLYVQQGLDMNSAMDLGIETLKMARVAGIDAAEATNSMTAALRGFNMELNETSATRINDVYSKLAQNTASNVQEISTAMTKTAALANSANMSFENTAAFLATIIESTREGAETAGTALKTVIARFTEVKKLYSEGELTGTDEEGQEVDVNKISKALRTAGIDMNAFFTGAKGLDEIFMELGSKWDSLTTVQQRYIATMAAGSRQQSRFLALMQNYSRTVELTQMAYNSAGSGQEQFEKTLDSLEAKLNKLKAAWDTFTMGIANSDFIKGVIDAGTKILDLLNSIIDKLSGGKGITKSILSLITAVGVFKGGRSLFNMILGKAAPSLIKNSSLKQLGMQGGITLATQMSTSFKNAFNRGLISSKSEKSKFSTWLRGTYGTFETKDIEAINSIKKDLFEGTDISAMQQQAIMLDIKTGNIDQANAKLKELGATSTATTKQTELLNQATVQSGVNLSNLATTAGILGGVFIGVGSAIENAGGKASWLGTVIKGVGIGLVSFMGIIKVLDVAIKTFSVSATASISSIPILGWIAAVISAIISLISIFSTLNETSEEKAERLSTGFEQASEGAKKVREDYENLIDTISKINEAETGLNELIKGTEEWDTAVQNLNQSILELIALYPELAGAVKYVNDHLVIDFESDIYKNYVEQSKQAAADAVYAEGASKYGTAATNVQKEAVAHTYLGAWENYYISLQDLIKTGSLYEAFKGEANRNYYKDFEKISPEIWGLIQQGIADGLISYDTTGTWYDFNKVIEQFLKSNNVYTDDKQVDIIRRYLGGVPDLERKDEYGTYTVDTKLFDPEYFSKLQNIVQGLPDLENIKITSQLSSMSNMASKFSKTLGSTLAFNMAKQLFNNYYKPEEMQVTEENRVAYAKAIGGESKNNKVYTKEGTDVTEGTKYFIAAKQADTKTAEELTNFYRDVYSKWTLDQQEVFTALFNEGKTLTLQQLKNLNDIDFKKYDEVIKKSEEYGGFNKEQIGKLYKDYLDSFNGIDISSSIGKWLEGFVDNIGQLNNLSRSLAIIKNKDTFTELISGLGGLDEEAKNLIATTDFTKAENIRNLTNSLEEMGVAVGSDFTNKLIAATGAVYTYSTTTVKTSLEALEGARSSYEKMLEGQRKFTEEEYAQFAQLEGFNSKEWIKSGSNEYTYLGETNSILSSIESMVAKLTKEEPEQLKQRIKEANQLSSNIEELNYTTSTTGKNAGKKVAFNGFTITNEIGEKEYVNATDFATAILSPEGIEFDDTQLKSFAEQMGIDVGDATGKVLLSILQAALADYGNIEGLESQLAILQNERSAIALQSLSGQAILNNEYDQETFEGRTTKDLLNAKLEIGDKENVEYLKRVLNLSEDYDDALKALMADSKTTQKNFDNLTKVYKENADALTEEGKKAGKYGVALGQLTAAAKAAFGNNEKITDKFVEAHLNDFKAMAEGSEESLQNIRQELLSTSTGIENVDQAVEQINGANFDITGTADVSDIINNLNLTKEEAEAAQKRLNELGYSAVLDITYKDDGMGNMVPDTYKLVVTDTAGQSVRANKSGGGGGGGGGKKEFKNDFDKYYNMVEDINELERLRNLLETDYEQLLKSEAISGKAIYDNLKKQIQLLKERRDITADLAEKRKGQIFETMNDKQYASVQKYAWWNDTDQTIEIDWDAINKVKDSEQGDLIKEYVSKLEGFQSQYDEQIEALEDIETTLQEIQKRGQEEYTSLEDRTRDALIKQIQDKIDELTAVDEAINDTNQKLMDSIQKELEKQRQERENAKTEEELADKEQRLAYLQQDSSGANALEIAKLQEELADARESYTDSLIDQKITELQEQNDEAAQQRQEQIDLMQQSLDWQEKSGAFWEQVYEYIQAGTDEVGTLVHGSELENLLKAGEAWDSLSEEGQMKWLEELENQVAQAIGYLSLSRQLEEIGTKEGTKITFTDAEGNTHTGKVDKNGNVVVTNSDGSTVTWKDVYQSYDGTYHTLETSGEAKAAPKPATNSGKPSSGGNNGSNNNNNNNNNNNESQSWALLKDGNVVTGIQGRPSKADGVNTFDTYVKAKEEANKINNAQKNIYLQAKTDLNRRLNEVRKNRELLGINPDSDPYVIQLKKEIESCQKKIDAIKIFKTGGLADYTGPAWLDGTPSKPELILNARDTENFIQLKDHLAALRQAGTLNAGGDNYYDIDVHVDSLGSDYDVDMAIDRIKTRLYQDGAYRNVNTLNRLR